MKFTLAGKKVLKQLTDGVDVTVEDLANLKGSFPDLVALLREAWCEIPGDKKMTRKRFKGTRVGTLYLTHGGSRLTLNLRFSFEES